MTKPRNASPKQIKVWIRDAAMSLFTGCDYDAFEEMRQLEDGWTEEETAAFLNLYNSEILKAQGQIERWFDGEAEIA